MIIKRLRNTPLAAACCAALLGVSTSASASGDIERGKAASASCAACHGPTGNSESTAFPKIAGQYRTYLLHALTAYTTGERTNAIMQGMVAPLSKQDREDLAAFYASQEGLKPLQGQR